MARHQASGSITKGRKAMAYAMLFPVATGKGGRGKKNPLVTKEFSSVPLSQARTVYEDAPTLAEKIRGGR